VLAGIHHGLTNKNRTGRASRRQQLRAERTGAADNLRDALRELDDSEVMAKYIDPLYIDVSSPVKESELAEFENSIF